MESALHSNISKQRTKLFHCRTRWKPYCNNYVELCWLYRGTGNSLTVRWWIRKLKIFLPSAVQYHVNVGRRGSVVACATYKRGIAGSIPGCAEYACFDVVLLGKALCSHVHSLDPGISGYLVGQWRLVCLNSAVRRKWQPGCMLPGELRWLMNEQVLWPGGNCVKSGE